MPTIEICADKTICDTLKSYLQRHGLIDLCGFQERADAHHDMTLRYKNQEKRYTTPVRLGEILDQIASYETKAQRRATFPQFAKYTLDPHQGTFTSAHKTITLTEKEVAILVHLHEHKGQVITRDALLHAVWNYAQGVETHTLETHIYRLRQKIEDDPTQPKILITEDDGYKV
ncbi:MAG: hypothetical protein COB36_07370 [Alphaproteobacteria bacterium]|nr:MAG: hypothetical protein COB36_07370 [Alphaproteobacteria bacterium]